ncbi:cell fate determining protein mab21-related [Holotrichia oblita]|uniref:Cell fate determining protein mab21-related n=2 Tax=Holotrichia oblita TaxID=644536 RepID=A0ACB9TY27_HOLOL|nr:cell fate determining protein mab21-related [Holotrichia oblita]
MLINDMKNRNALFKDLYKHIYYGGSYYDGLKISKPEEYDCDLLLELPKVLNPLITTVPEHPGFVQMLVTDLEKYRTHTAFNPELQKRLLDNQNYLRVDKLRSWVESILDKVLSDLPKEKNFHSFTVDNKTYYFKKTKGGPAFTVHITESIEDTKSVMDIDLVPCFNFKDNDWPRCDNFRRNPSTKNRTFFVVPKKPKVNVPNADRLWRLSFQQQELEFLDQRQSLKPALKLLKRLRDQYNHKSISSYFIKTVFLWQVDECDESFWKEKLSTVFMVMLKRYHQRLDNKYIPYFWNKDFNLIKDIKQLELDNIKNTVAKIITKIDANLDDPFIVASYLVPKQELEQLRQNVTLGKKFEKLLQSRISIDVPDGAVCNRSISNDTTSTVTSSAAVEEALKEINRKLDAITDEQRTIRSLVERLIDHQMNTDDKLREINQRNMNTVLDDLLGASAFNGICPRLPN